MQKFTVSMTVTVDISAVDEAAARNGATARASAALEHGGLLDADIDVIASFPAGE